MNKQLDLRWKCSSVFCQSLSRFNDDINISMFPVSGAQQRDACIGQTWPAGRGSSHHSIPGFRWLIVHYGGIYTRGWGAPCHVPQVEGRTFNGSKRCYMKTPPTTTHSVYSRQRAKYSSSPRGVIWRLPPKNNNNKRNKQPWFTPGRGWSVCHSNRKFCLSSSPYPSTPTFTMYPR